MDSFLKNTSRTRLSSVTSHPPPTTSSGYRCRFSLACLPSDPLRCVSPPSGTVTDPGGWNEQRSGGPIPADATCFYLRLGARRLRCEPVRTRRNTTRGFLQPSPCPWCPPAAPLPSPSRPVTLQRSDTVRSRFQHIQRGVKTHKKAPPPPPPPLQGSLLE